MPVDAFCPDRSTTNPKTAASADTTARIKRECSLPSLVVTRGRIDSSLIERGGAVEAAIEELAGGEDVRIGQLRDQHGDIG